MHGWSFPSRTCRSRRARSRRSCSSRALYGIPTWCRTSCTSLCSTPMLLCGPQENRNACPHHVLMPMLSVSCAAVAQQTILTLVEGMRSSRRVELAHDRADLIRLSAVCSTLARERSRKIIPLSAVARSISWLMQRVPNRVWAVRACASSVLCCAQPHTAQAAAQQPCCSLSTVILAGPTAAETDPAQVAVYSVLGFDAAMSAAPTFQGQHFDQFCVRRSNIQAAWLNAQSRAAGVHWLR